MNYGLITLAAVSCKAEASHKAEQINQLLFGDCYTIMEETADWYKISSAYDKYEGWIHKKHHTSLTEEEFKILQKDTPFVALDLLGSMKENKSSNLINIPIGSSLYLSEKKSMLISNVAFKYTGKTATQKKADLLKYASLYLNTPYLWGGRTPLGIDCSGFVQMAHKLCGIKLPRDSWQQARSGKQIKKLSDAKKGDLVFFGAEDKITHVGILASPKLVIHASGKVKMEKIDETGIYNAETKSHTHLLKSIRRL